jgi:DNA-binding response OmpR family regulator
MEQEKKKVLVVEDDYIIAQIHKNLAEQQGFSVCVAKTFEAFQERVREDIFAVITDDQIPNSETDLPMSHSEQIVDMCLKQGVSKKNILIVSATMRQNSRGIIVIQKGRSSFPAIKNFLENTKQVA